MKNPYRNPSLRAAWAAGRRSRQHFEAKGYDPDAWQKGFRSVDNERLKAARERRLKAVA